MVKSLSKNQTNPDDIVDVPKKFKFGNMDPKEILDEELDFFIDGRNSFFFEIFKLDIKFLGKDCSLWHQ